MDRGNRFFASGKYPDAILNYRNAIQKDTSFAEAYYRLGIAERKSGDATAARSDLGTAHTLAPTRDDVSVALADVDLELLWSDLRRPKSLYQELTQVSDALLAHNPDSYDGLRIKGNLSWLDRNDNKALDYLERANAIRPGQPDLIFTWSQVLFEVGQSARAEKLAIDTIRARPDYSPLYDVLVRYYLSARRPKDAEDVLKLRIARNPSQISYAIELASFYALTAKRPEMTATLERLTGDPKDFPDARMRVGDFYASIQDWPNALREYREGAKATGPARVAYLKRISDTLLAAGKGDEAAAVVDEILKAEPNNEAAMAVKAAILASSKSQDQQQAGIRQLRQLVARSPENAVWRLNLGLALLSRGDVPSASAEFEEAIRRRDDFLPPRLLLAQINALQRRYSQTLAYANAALGIQADLVEARILRAAALVGLSQFDQARTELTALERADPGNAEVQFQLAFADVAEKHYALAENRLQKLYAAPATHARALEGLASLYEAENKSDKVLPLLIGEVSSSPQSAVGTSLLAREYLRLGRYDQALQLFQAMSKADPGSSEIYRLIGAAWEGKGDRQKAIDSFSTAKRVAPTDAGAIAGLADLLRMAGRRSEAMSNYRDLLKVDPGNATAMNNLAYMLAEDGTNIDEAQGLAEGALQKAPNNIMFRDTVALVYLRKKQNESALREFSRILRESPNDPLFHYHYGLALIEAGQPQKAKVELEAALHNSPPLDIKRGLDDALSRVR
ncbi:MAG TPA: tetratricopeptide repeat protein [Bryobacteraceae bacterium]|nr:tetratricopeptide repeat protein [Bryobacteraceae bacterium]